MWGPWDASGQCLAIRTHPLVEFAVFFFFFLSTCQDSPPRVSQRGDHLCAGWAAEKEMSQLSFRDLVSPTLEAK